MEYDLTRRRLLLSLLTTLLPTVACSSKELNPLCPTNPAISDLRAPLTIDVHAHVFNGSDLQIKEFLAQAVIGHDDSELYSLGKVMGGLLQALAWHAAPSAREEMEALGRYQEEIRNCTGTEEIRQVAALAFQEGYKRGRRELQAAAKAVSSTPEAAAVLGPRVGLPGSGLGALIEGLPETFDRFEEQRSERATVLGSQPHLLGYIQFVLHHFNYRHVNAIDYLTTYSKDSPRKIDLLVASMVDYDWWLAKGKTTRTSLADQVDVMSRVAVLTNGRVHGFVPFCPFRETMTAGIDGVGDSLRLVKRAIQSHGFIGVKLYPPMGFAALGNTQLSVWQGKTSLPTAASEPGFGKRLDAAMCSLFEWCQAEEIPIMAHANRSNGPYDDFKLLAGSEYWQIALEKYPGLKISFGHFGDTDLEDHDGKLSSPFVKLMTDGLGPGYNVFADSGYFAGVLSNSSAMVDVLEKLYSGSKDRILAERLMYGTDWTMILPQRNVNSYLAEFVGVMKKLDAGRGGSMVRKATLSEAFFSRNAVHFLGLEKGKPARTRLEAFYDRYALGEPDWMKKLG